MEDVEKAIPGKMAKWYYSLITAPFTARFPVYTLPVGIRVKEECELLDVPTLAPLLRNLGGSGITIAKYIGNLSLGQTLHPRQVQPASLLWIDRPLQEFTVEKHLLPIARNSVGYEEQEAMARCRTRVVQQLLGRLSGLRAINSQANLSTEEIRKKWRQRLDVMVSDYNSSFQAYVNEAIEESKKSDLLTRSRCEGLRMSNVLASNDVRLRGAERFDPSCDWYFFTKSTEFLSYEIAPGFDHPPLFFNPKTTAGLVVEVESDVMDGLLRDTPTRTNDAAWEIVLAFGRIPLDSSVQALINNPAFKTDKQGGLQLPEDMKVAVDDMFRSLQHRLTPRQREKLAPYTIQYDWPGQDSSTTLDPYVLWARADSNAKKIDISPSLVRALYIHSIRERAPSFVESVYNLAVDNSMSLDDKLQEVALQHEFSLVRAYRQFRQSLLLPLGHEMAHIYLGNEGLFPVHERCDQVAIEAIDPIERGASLTVFTELMEKAYAEKENSLWFGVRSDEDWEKMLRRTRILTELVMKPVIQYQ